MLAQFSRLLVPGHSLGGALATLAAYDIRKQLQASKMEHVEVVCYSFGAPRTGNHAFAHSYGQVVPDSFSVINDQVRLGAARGMQAGSPLFN